MKHRHVFIVCLVILLLTSCTGSEAWTDALGQTAPPDPDDRPATARPARSETADSNAELREETVQQQQPAAGQRTQPDEPVTELTVLLQAYPSCHVGSVRLYADRRYLDAFDDQGRVTVSISPGQHVIEAWDSAGHWLTRVNLPAGSQQITLTCEEKMDFNSSRSLEEEQEPEENQEQENRE